MLSLEEQRLYHWIMAHWATGAGAVVDLGCFVGGSTARLAEGHRQAGLTSKIHAYDYFQASEAAKERHLYAAGISPFAGSDTLRLASRLLAPWFDHIELHPGQIEAQGWAGGLIEVLVMDATKTRQSGDRMAELFFPHLIPGRSLVVQQDYLHWKQPWVAAQMERMARWFTPVAHAPGHTLVFRCDAAIDGEALAAGHLGNLSPHAINTALLKARGRMRAFRLGNAVNALLQAARANRGVSEAWEMVARP